MELRDGQDIPGAIGKRVIVIGRSVNTKGSALIGCGFAGFEIADFPAWPDNLVGKNLKISGELSVERPSSISLDVQNRMNSQFAPDGGKSIYILTRVQLIESR